MENIKAKKRFEAKGNYMVNEKQLFSELNEQ
jgi:hypothetical protein